METLADIIRAQHLARGAHDDPFVDALLAELVRVAEEVCVLRDRLETCQLLADAGKPTDVAAIDAVEPDAEALERRLVRHREYFEALFGRLADASASEPP